MAFLSGLIVQQGIGTAMLASQGIIIMRNLIKGRVGFQESLFYRQTANCLPRDYS